MNLKLSTLFGPASLIVLSTLPYHLVLGNVAGFFFFAVVQTLLRRLFSILINKKKSFFFVRRANLIFPFFFLIKFKELCA